MVAKAIIVGKLRQDYRRRLSQTTREEYEMIHKPYCEVKNNHTDKC